jgi:hypothetical protein
MDDRLAESGLEQKQEVSYSTGQLIKFIWSMNQKGKGCHGLWLLGLARHRIILFSDGYPLRQRDCITFEFQRGYRCTR